MKVRSRARRRTERRGQEGEKIKMGEEQAASGRSESRRLPAKGGDKQEVSPRTKYEVRYFG